ncbi:hypothetical protein [Paramagnetospirillum kuznetsovii]|uniref:hypothetical protein n=1 Tax=Paramagnetospirillum kuznetsovii TaxID=2053833 RepID=UPI001374BF14|nr:hypothetical protein [Paramagnetospirillum kuznetsovii]
MGDLLISFTAIAAAAIIGSHAFRYASARFGQNVAFAIMAVLLGIAFAVQTYLEKS